MELRLTTEELRPLVQTILTEVIEQREEAAAKLGGRETLDEAAAADFLGIRQKQLAAIRRRGEIEHVVISGRFIRYRRQHLLGYLAAHSVRGGAA